MVNGLDPVTGVTAAGLFSTMVGGIVFLFKHVGKPMMDSWLAGSQANATVAEQLRAALTELREMKRHNREGDAQ